MFEGAARAERNAHDAAMRAAWVTAHLSRVKRLPKIETLMAPSVPRRVVRQDWRAMLSAAEAWVAAAGQGQ